MTTHSQEKLEVEKQKLEGDIHVLKEKIITLESKAKEENEHMFTVTTQWKKALKNAIDNSGEMLTFSSKELGISFQYPAAIGKIVFEEKNGETGKEFWGNALTSGKMLTGLYFGGSSKDFSVGRDGIYFSGNAEEVAKDKEAFGRTVKFIKKIPIQGGTAYILKGISDDGGPGTWLRKDNYGALINLKGKIYQGIQFGYGDDNGPLSVDAFENIIKSIVITNPS